ncbi:MAG: hypothetical protein JWL59_2214 [Chthoniobacteraceae bacterium]|nr:hypothetical protein [Chthoniobacteraceae bacterium]
MKIPRFLLPLGLSFALGALCVPKYGVDRLPEEASLKGGANRGAASTAARDTRISRVLSALLEPGHLKQQHALFLAIGDLNPEDLGEMMARANTLPPRFRREVLGLVFERWFELNPDAAGGWARQHSNETRCWEVWARRSPKIIIEEIHRRPWIPSAQQILKTAISGLVGSGSKEQMLAVAALPSNHARDGFFNEKLSEWTAEDPAAAFAFIQRSDADLFRSDRLHSVLSAWAQKDPVKAAEAIDSILPQLTKGGWHTLSIVAGAAEALAEQGVALALDWAARLPFPLQEAGLRAAAGHWAETDPIAALDWCLENRFDAARTNLEPTSYSGWNFPTKPVIAVAAKADAEGTLRWIESLSRDTYREALLECALTELCEHDVPLVIAHLNKLPADSQERIGFALGVNYFGPTELGALPSWSQRLPAGPVRNAAIETVVTLWLIGKPAPEGMGVVVDLFPAASEHDAVLSAFSSFAAADHPDIAAEYALAISDPVIRRDVLDSTLPQWLRWHPDEAQMWLNKMPGLPPAWKAAWIAESRTD